MSKLYSEMHNLFQVSKTLRFELKPIGKTKEYFEKYILKQDEVKAETFKKVKKYCDEYHKHFIEECLKDFENEDFKQLLNNYINLYSNNSKNEKEEKEFENIKKELRKMISAQFKKNDLYKGLFGKEIIKNYLKDYYRENDEILNEVSLFDDFTTYFTGYNQNRENMYSEEEKHTAIAYRLIDENLPTYIKNIKAFGIILNEIPDIKKQIQDNLNLDTEKYFTNIENYTHTISQKQIEEYNLAISGKAEENTKIQGINELVNLHNQKNKIRLPKLKELYKQILSDSTSTSFVLDLLQNDKEIIDSINLYYKIFEKEILNKDEFKETLSNINKYNLEQIYINNDLSLTALSKDVYGDWAYIQELLEKEWESNYTGKAKKGTDKYTEAKEKDLKKIKELSIAKIDELIKKYETEDKKIGKIVEHYKNELPKLFKQVNEKYSECKNVLEKNYEENSNELLKDKNAIEKIKDLLDSIKSVQEFVKLLIPRNKALETDSSFYNNLNYNTLTEIIPLYNKVRNYLTKKPFSTEKFKLNFDCPTLLSGWDLNKEEANLGTLFEKDGNYYLGIINKDNRKIFSSYKNNSDNNSYKKIEYKLLPGPNKMLPKVFFSKSRIEEFNPSEELLLKYSKGLHKKGVDFDLDFCHELIEFFKSSIQKHEDWSKFNFNFSKTSTYEDISQFYKEVEYQGYKITYTDISSEYINQLVDEGKLYLFQIYNKDFSKYSKGKPNLHTLYWKTVFDEENLKDVVYKLNGGAEIFYRKKSIGGQVTHPKNQPVDNKNPNNPKKQSIFEYDLIKDKRYSLDKFQFHVPITMNFKAIGENKLNDRIKSEIKKFDDVHIIGIDRGERHLLYITVINSKGEIVEQCSLNKIGIKHETDYHELLDRKEKERDNARKSWGTIENIKELKEGYMSQVVHKIVELMFKYNAIVVLEDLNSGFKNSRKKVEKSVYDKFETMLVNKLEYLVNKDVQGKFEQGGVLNAYQLAKRDIEGRQNGVIFYIPAWCTSKIDPITGFVNLFDTKKINTEFVEKFDNIRFNEKENYFEFDFDYTNISDKSCGKRKSWTICSYGERIRTFRNPHKNSEWDNETVKLTYEFKNLFDRYGIDYKNIKEEIISKSNSQFFNAVKEKDGFYGFGMLFKLLVQLRNSITGDMEDYILSPVKNKQGYFYDSRNCSDKLPKDADANGAYNIARKGLILVQRIKESTKDKIDYSIKNEDWLNFVQEKDK